MKLKGTEVEYGLREYAILTLVMLFASVSLAFIIYGLISYKVLSAMIGFWFFVGMICDRNELFNFEVRKKILVFFYNLFQKEQMLH